MRNKRNKIAGIYSLTNKTTGKRYIGQTVYLNGRKGDHLLNLRRNQHDNDYLQKAFNKYGEEDFMFEVLEVIPKLEDGVNDKDKLTEREQYWMDYYNCYDREYGYNINPLAAVNPMHGKNHTLEAKQKMSEAAKGRVLSEENRKKLTESRKGKPSNSAKDKRDDIVFNQKYEIYCRSALYEYHIIDLDNTEHIIYSIEDFCDLNRLSKTRLRQMFTKDAFYRGWSGYRIPIKESTYNTKK